MRFEDAVAVKDGIDFRYHQSQCRALAWKAMHRECHRLSASALYSVSILPFIGDSGAMLRFFGSVFQMIAYSGLPGHCIPSDFVHISLACAVIPLGASLSAS